MGGWHCSVCCGRWYQHWPKLKASCTKWWLGRWKLALARSCLERALLWVSLCITILQINGLNSLLDPLFKFSMHSNCILSMSDTTNVRASAISACCFQSLTHCCHRQSTAPPEALFGTSPSRRVAAESSLGETAMRAGAGPVESHRSESSTESVSTGWEHLHMSDSDGLTRARQTKTFTRTGQVEIKGS